MLYSKEELERNVDLFMDSVCVTAKSVGKELAEVMVAVMTVYRGQSPPLELGAGRKISMRRARVLLNEWQQQQSGRPHPHLPPHPAREEEPIP